MSEMSMMGYTPGFCGTGIKRPVRNLISRPASADCDFTQRNRPRYFLAPTVTLVMISRGWFNQRNRRHLVMWAGLNRVS